METTEMFNIYECFDQDGEPSHYVCWGHVDSERFRNECFREYSVRPLVVQHRWQHTRKVLSKEPGRKRNRGRFTSMTYPENRRNATAVTVGIVSRPESEQVPGDIDIN